MRWKSVLVVCLAIPTACGSASGDGSAFDLPDASHDIAKSADAFPSDSVADLDALAADSALDGVADIPVTADADAQHQADGQADAPVGPLNAPPQFKPLPAVSLAQGATTSLDLAPFVSDAEDAAATLQLSWSAQHVALNVSADHLLYIVAPTTWFGVESILLTLTDSAGGQAQETLHVTVTEVEVVPPKPVETCGQVTFALQPQQPVSTVAVAGTFNGWQQEAMAANGNLWSLQKVLKPGLYQYKFVLDAKTWLADPSNPNQVPDGYNGKNSVLEVPACAP